MWEAEIRGMVVPSHLGQKILWDPHLNRKKLNMVAHTCHLSNSRKGKIGGLWAKQAWAKKWEPVSKITGAKQNGSTAQVAECETLKKRLFFL
jgi:hypothetical protein